MKKNVMMRIASVLMIAVLLTTCVISGTFAKYVSDATGTATVKIAKWNIAFESNSASFTDGTTFDFFTTLMDSNGEDEELDVQTEDAEGNPVKVIAPGTSGSFSFEVTNDSQVNALFTIDLDVEDALETLPLTYVYKVNGSEVNTLAAIPLTYGASATVTVEWVWAFGEDSASIQEDTDLGENNYSTNYTVTATLTATQVD